MPSSLAGYVNQQRRWVKSTMANDLHLVGALDAFEAASGTEAQKTWRFVQWLILCMRYAEFLCGLGLGTGALPSAPGTDCLTIQCQEMALTCTLAYHTRIYMVQGQHAAHRLNLFPLLHRWVQTPE